MTFLFTARSQQGGGAMEGGSRPPAPARMPSMFRRLMMARVTPAERLAAAAAEGGAKEREKDERPPPAAVAEAEVGSVALDRMVLSFMEDSAAAVAAAAERPPRGRCAGNCFNGNNYDCSDDEDFDFLPSFSAPAAAPPAAGDSLELLKGLVQCASTAERNLLADASRIADRCGGKGGRKKAEVRRAVAEGLRALGYDAAVCVSRWEKAASHPAGEHEYIDALVSSSSAAAAAPAAEGMPATRLVVEVDFPSEFEVARPTKAYRATLQALPPLFVGTPDRLGRVVALVANAARQSLRKRGLHFPPWRKPEYMRAKWLAPHARAGGAAGPDTPATPVPDASFSAGASFELRFDEKPKAPEGTAGEDGEEEEKVTVVVSPWRAEEPVASEQRTPPTKAKGKVVTGLASVL